MADTRTLSERINDLIEGKPGAAAAVADLLRLASLVEWLDASRHVEPAVRAAAVIASNRRPFDEVVARITELLTDTSEPVTAACSSALRQFSSLSFDDAVLLHFLVRLGDDAAQLVRRVGGRPAFTEQLLTWLEADDHPLEDAAAAALRDADGGAVMAELVRILLSRTYSDATLLSLIDHHITTTPGSLDVASLSTEQRMGIGRMLSDYKDTRFTAIRYVIDEVTRVLVDVDALTAFGRNLSADHHQGFLPKAFLQDASIERVIARVEADTGSRSVAIVGKPGTGKTALINGVVAALTERDWTVIEVVPSELLVGTKYLGEWETRVQKLIDAAKAPRRVVLVMPSVQDILQVGKSSSRDTSVSSLLMPLLDRGELIVIGESDGEAFTKAAGHSPAFRRLFALFETVPASVEATRSLVSLVAEAGGVSLPPEVVEQFIHLADGFVTSVEQPGRTLGLLRRALDACIGQPTVRDLLEIISESTGAPVDFLDHNVALDLNETRRFLETRVVGQPEAISAVLDTVTLIKAGLTDPLRPNGVMLFVGPTGVGKTELARALASFLFGDAGRLLRFDMSEFASYESYERLIGSKNGTGGLLTDAVRAQPFSAVLLDEIEKAHANVFDLLLQVFDAGRLTDGRGHTIDFRNTVIILTSNVGSRVATRAGAGFTSAVDVPSSEAIQRSLEQQFRPEFLGRLDRVVTFQPLSPESAERIVRREITAVLRRSGITTRRIAVDVDPGVVALLLAEGYSPAYGARPLKRAIDSHFLLPLARAIATGSVASGSVVAAEVKGGAIAIRIVRDGTPATDHQPEVVSLKRTRSVGELQLLVSDLEPFTRTIADEKQSLLITQSESDFWSDQRSALATLDRVQRLDRLLSDAGRLARDIERTERNRDPRKQAAFVAAHVREHARLRSVIDGGDLRDAAVFIERIGPSADLDGVGLLVRLYQGMASRFHLEAEQVDDVRNDDLDRAVLVVSGAGAAQLLSQESGLHRFRSGEATRRVEENISVRVAPYDPDAVTVEPRGATAISYVSSEGRIGGKKRALVKATATDGSSTSIEILVPVTMQLDRDALAELACGLLVARNLSTTPLALVRRYDLGASPVAVDSRTGARSGRLGDVLAGNLDVFDRPVP
jgi:ATP-dependent Clp protease ATP-binding subunit ClpC